jgi:sugar phosphate isomerase/epimerase
MCGQIAARREPREPATAERHFRDALDLAERCGMRPLMGHCHLGLAEALGDLGCRVDAQAELEEARRIYDATAMTRWRRRVETVGAG